jgi:magnesium transporter
MANDDNKTSASALGELKETIRSQQKEIERLKAKLAKGGDGEKGSAAGHGHGHGGDVELSPEELARYLHSPFYRVGLERVGWLGIFLASLSATAVIMNVFEHTLEKHIELALFVPLLAGHGGNTGGQTVGTILSALSAGTVKVSDAPKVVWKECMAGILSGSILGAIVAPIAYKILGVSNHVAVVLLSTLPLVSMIASTIGSIIPFVCVMVGLDPSVIAAPAMTSLVDVAGLMGYFMIANYIFKLYGLEL